MFLPSSLVLQSFTVFPRAVPRPEKVIDPASLIIIPSGRALVIHDAESLRRTLNSGAPPEYIS